ncbi:MAG: glycosyltransferase [bacterium]|nr:glycosyltransferase [bacterium]
MIYFLIWILVFLYVVLRLTTSYLKTPKLKVSNLEIDKTLSIIIPARNEEDNIKNVLESVLNQDYKNYEVIVVDDGSTDNTPNILKNYVGKIKLVRIEEKPHNWCGKNYAVYVGFKESKNEILAFIDADVFISPDMLKKAVSYMEKNNLDMICFLPKLKMETFWEKVLMHIMGSFIFFFFPPHIVNRPKTTNIMANGQFILIKRNVYEKLNGHEAVKSEVEEDVELAKLVKKSGYSYALIAAFDEMRTRMYKGFSGILRGWSKGIYIHIKKDLKKILILLILFFVFWIYPFIEFLLDIFKLKLDETAISIALLYIFDFLGRAKVRHHPKYFIFYPLGCMIIFALFIYNLYRFMNKKGIAWKGRVYS